MNLPERFNFAEHLFALNRNRADKIAYIDDRDTLSYGELERRARQLAGVLLSTGVKPKERALLLMLDSIDWPVSFLGCLYAGVLPVAVNTLLTTEDYAYMLDHSQATVALVSSALLPALQTALATQSQPLKLILVSDPAGAGHSGGTDLHKALASAVPMNEPVLTHAADHAFWLYSSGSTGRPKGTVHTHGKPVVDGRALWQARARHH